MNPFMTLSCHSHNFKRPVEKPDIVYFHLIANMLIRPKNWANKHATRKDGMCLGGMLSTTIVVVSMYFQYQESNSI
jgi:hypothetical protein